MSTTAFKGAFINNAWVEEAGASDISVDNPATGKCCGTISALTAVSANAALEAAKSAAEGWGKMSMNDRATAIAAYAAKLRAHREEIVALLIQETGKVTGNAEYDFDMLPNCLDFHVEEAKRNYGSVIPSMDGGALSYTKYSAVGVVAAVLTWNFPILNLAYKLGPILATGCTTVIKPSEVTPLATSRCIELITGTGIPAGVVNCVNGTGLALVQPLCASKIPRLLTTIGSSVMGRRMIGYGATSIKRFSLELGGDCPVLIFADCDLEAAVNDIVGLKYDNGGQICVSPNRVLVERSVYEKFIEMAAAKAKGYVHGSGADDGAVLQPVCSQQSLDRLVGYVDDAVAKGARKICGGAKADREGFFLEATILADTTKDMKCSCEEIFGPILTVQPFETADEAFTKANDSDMGLSGYVYTSSLATTLRAEEELMCGNVLINGIIYSIELPHGGVKESGYGKDISHLSLRDYYEIRRVSIKRSGM